MKRILLVLAVAVLMAVMLVAMAAPAFAKNNDFINDRPGNLSGSPGQSNVDTAGGGGTGSGSGIRGGGLETSNAEQGNTTQGSSIPGRCTFPPGGGGGDCVGRGV